MNILVIYYYKGEYPPRAATKDHLYSFLRYAEGHTCFYLNVALGGVPRYLRRVKFDLIIFHTLFFSSRWNRAAFPEVAARVATLKQTGAVKVALPQDEFLNTDLLCAFINKFQVDCVFTAAQESDWGTIYPDVDRRRVKFVTVLTGYLDGATLDKINELTRKIEARPVDIGYRAWRAPAWLGRHGILKTRISDLFREQAPQKGLVADISTRAEDTFLGDAWYEFLLRCKYMIGVEGGASILDRDGTIRARTEAYVSAHPGASFEEIEANCFPGLDGTLSLFAISPRHLEACATRTCQVLIEGEYNGVLRAGEHYVALRRDLSNAGEVLDLVARGEGREAMVERAYRDVVASGKYTYRTFVRTVIAEALGGEAGAGTTTARLPHRLASMADRLSWIIVMLHWYIIVPAKRHARQWLVSAFSERAVSSAIRRIKRNTEA